MTVETDLDRAQYATNGTTGPWTVPFYFLADTDLAVTHTDAAGNDTLLTLNVDYSVTGAGAAVGGTITTTVAYAASGKLVILRDIELLQELHYVNGDSFPASAHESGLDRLTMIAQQLREQINRAVTLPASDTSSGVLPTAAQRAGFLLGFDGAGGLTLIASAVQSATALALSLLSTAGSTLVSILQAGAGAVLRTVQDKLRETVSVIDYGGVLNDSSNGTRTANTAALAAARAARKRVFIPEGDFWIAANTPLAAFWDIEGAGSEATVIKGDGDLFSVTTADNGEMRRFSNLKIMNDVTKGKLFKYVSATDTNRIEFDHVNFDNANYHVHCSGGGNAVSWKFSDCRFINAAIESRHFEGLWVYREAACYTWFCAIGLRCTNGAVSSCSIAGSTFEQMDDSAIVLDASNVAYEVSAFTINAHFEANGKTGLHNADVQLLTSAATRLRGVRLLGCGFFTPTATQAVRVSIAAGGGGNIDNVEIDGGSCMGVVPLCTDTPLIKVRNVYYQSVTPRATNSVPVQVQYQYSQNYLGGLRVPAGAEVGSGATIATLTAPSGVRDWQVRVSGNSYNGVPNSNTALNITYMSGTTANTRALTDVNHSAGANQGFVVTYNSGTRVITVANKAAMTNNQNGEVFAEFFA